MITGAPIKRNQLTFLDDLREKMSLTPKEEQKLIDGMKCLHFKKGETVDSQNEIMKNMIFIIKGSARTFYIERAQEHNFAFTFSSHFLIRPEKLLRSQEQRIMVQFMEPTDACYVPLPEFHTIDKNRQGEIFKFICIGLSNYADFLEEQMVMLHMSAKDRYKWALEKYPNILDLVTITQLASFLNVTKETLYRIRGNKY